MFQKTRTTPAQRFIQYALLIGALELVPKGRTLKSGRISPYFFNSGKFNSGKRVAELAAAYARVISENLRGGFAFDLLYGPPYKGTILVPTIAMMLDTLGCTDIPFCTSRKESKGHGEHGLLIGAPIAPGNGVLIIDDVITDGGTKREAVDFIRHYKGKPTGLVISFDRQERGEKSDLSATQEFERNYGIPVRAIATLTDLISVLEDRLGEGQNDRFGDTMMLKELSAYRQKYGVS